MEGTRGDAEIRATDGEIQSRMHLRTGASGSDEAPDDSVMDHLREDARERIDEIGQRASDLAGRMRHSLRDQLDGSGLVGAIREHPLTAVGLAASTGFVLAIATASSERNWVVERARRQLRAAIISALTAAAAHELRSIVGADEGFGQLIQTLLGHEEEEFAGDPDDYEYEV